MIPAPGDDESSRLDPDRFRSDLAAIYADLDAEIHRLVPVCNLSGLCCRFEEYGHTLFLSAPEAALLLSDAPPPSRALDEGASCPWQDFNGRCTAREARPLGCRIYFCDPAHQEASPLLSETYIARLKALADRLGLPWEYAPLHRHLRRALDDGRWDECAAADAQSIREHSNS
jgi:Fe-S-cluster containining protein